MPGGGYKWRDPVCVVPVIAINIALVAVTLKIFPYDIHGPFATLAAIVNGLKAIDTYTVTLFSRNSRTLPPWSGRVVLSVCACGWLALVPARQ
jgi:hypothetical protein